MAVTDELRAMAVSVGLDMPKAATLMMGAADAIDRIDAEADRLRELVRDYDQCTMHADCAMCEYDGNLSTHCPLSPCFPDADELRKLGVDE